MKAAPEGRSVISLQLILVPTGPLRMLEPRAVPWETLARGRSRKAFHERKQKDSLPLGAGREAGFPA